MTELYDILNVAPDVDEATIKRAYRWQAKELHPDRNPGDEAAAEKFRLVADAYAVLSDPARRARYDATGDPRAEPDRRLSRAANVLLEAMVGAAGAVGQRGQELGKADLKAAIKGQLASMRLYQQREMESWKEQEAAWTMIAQRFTAKGDGPNLLGTMAERQAANARASQAVVEQLLEAIADAEILLERHDYRWDKPASCEGTWMGQRVAVNWNDQVGKGVNRDRR